MKHDFRHTKTNRPADRERSRKRDDGREPKPDREGRVGAAQMAAPATRTWRRAGRFASLS